MPDEPIEVLPKVDEGANLEDAFQNLFKTSASGSGEEELLRIASRYSLQLSAQQIKVLLYIEWWAETYKKSSRQGIRAYGERLSKFIERYLEYKQYNGSDIFVMKALEYISLRKFINDDAMKVNIEK